MHFIFIFILTVLGVKCSEKDSLVSAEYDFIAPLANDRIDNIYYNPKSDFVNFNKERLYLRNRRFGSYPLVEVGPGSFKAEYEKQPSHFLVGHYKKLFALKKKMDDNKN